MKRKRFVWKRITALMLALICILALAACGSSSSPQTTVEETTTETENWTVTEMDVESANGNIYGEWYMPLEEKESYPTVILVHGFNANISTLTAYAEAYAEAGFAVYVFDFVNGGSKTQSGNADGKMTDMSVLTEYQNLCDVVDMVSETAYVDTDHLFMLGASQGGLVTAYTTAQMPERIKAVVLLYPYFCVQDQIHEQFASADDVPDTFEWLGMEVSRIYATDLMSFDIFEEITKYPNDVLIIHGTADTTAPISYSEKALDYYPNVSLSEYEGAGHAFSNSEDKQKSVEESLAFFEEEAAK